MPNKKPRNGTTTQRRRCAVVRRCVVSTDPGPSECTVTSPECTTDSDERGVMDWLGDTLAGDCTVVWPGQRRYR